MQHTQGKWETHPVTDFNVVYVVVNGEAEEICRTPNATPTGKANARRIVACVNACEGYSTEEIEQHMTPFTEKIGKWVKLCKEQEKKLSAEKAKAARLLEALKQLIRESPCDSDTTPNFLAANIEALAAITEAEETVQPRTTAVEPPAKRLFKATKEITSYLRKQYPWNLSEPFKSLLIEAENALNDPHGYEPKGIVAPVKQPEK